jgi:hypothetical protein
MSKRYRAVAMKIEGSEEQVKPVTGAEEAWALKELTEEARAEEQRLLQEAKAAHVVHLAADARWAEKQHEAAEEQSRVEHLREIARRLEEEAVRVQAVAVLGEKRAAALSQQADELNAGRSAVARRWCEAMERWERFRHSVGLPFYDPEVGPPEWFTRPHSQAGLLKLFSEL